MSNRVCVKQVYSRGYSDFQGHACGSAAKVVRDGKPYCRVHDPVAREERFLKRPPSKWEREMAQTARDRADLKELVLAARNFIDQPGLKERQQDLKDALIPYERITR